MNILKLAAVTSAEESAEVLEEVLQYSTDDIYRVLSDCSDTLEDISDKLDVLQEIGSGILQLLQESFIDSLVALVLMLVCFEIWKLVRGWKKGVLLGGRYR